MGEGEGFDFDAYIQRARSGPCFVCRIVAGDPDSVHEVVYEDPDHIAFLDRYPTTPGYVIVSPKEHRELVTGDFDLASYHALQEVVFRVGEAMRGVLKPARLYIASLGSTYGNSHVHWHLIAVPDGVPQNTTWLSKKLAGVADVTAEDRAAMAVRLRAALAGG